METDEPEIFIRGHAEHQEPEQVRPKKKVAISKRDQDELRARIEAEGEKEHTETLPREVIQTEEGALI